VIVTDFTRRVIVLLGLATLGVALAWTGTALGVGDAIDDSRESGRVDISGDGVTFADKDQQVSLVENLTTTDAVEVSATDGRITVTTSDRGLLTADQRARARKIARENATVARVIEQTGDVRLTVEPIRKLKTTSVDRVEANVNVTTNGTADLETYTFESTDDVTVEQDGDSVTVASGQSDAAYVEDEAVVRIRDATTGEASHSAIVDLANGTVIESPDWDG
jgi:phage FluMu protein gp41